MEQILATTHALLVAENLADAAELVRQYPARIEQTGYDNLNGRTDIWEILFEVPPSEYARLSSQRKQLEDQISTHAGIVLGTQDWCSAKIVPAKILKKEWRVQASSLSRQIRRNILDGLRLERVNWNGTLDDVEFLSRIFDLTLLPSFDTRYKNAAGDIWQHCINNNDWDADWVFSDSRFELLDGRVDTFLSFLCEVVHPVVRPDRDEALKLVAHFNDQLRPAGWEIFEEERIAGRPRFAYRIFTLDGKRSVLRAHTVAEALDAGSMAKAIERLERAVDVDPDLAIGTAKELIESCCKTILTKRGVPFGKADDLSTLTKNVAKELQLVPEGITDEAKGAENIRLILRNLTQLTNNLAQLRGLYGTGHGRDGKYRGLQPRHARLAVASAVAFIDFVAETYREREAVASTPKSADL